MPTYRLERSQIVNYPLDLVWTFFSQPSNLARLSPPQAGLKVISPADGVDMYPGIIVHLRMGPAWAPKLNWHSEISQIVPQQYFIDRQLSGPFAEWHHEHRFEARGPDRTEIIDLLHYRPPLGPLGALANWLFVGRQVRKIFDYRKEITKDLDFSN